MIDKLGLTPANTYISVIAVMEIQQGIDKLWREPKTHPRARALDEWLVGSIDQFAERVLIMDVDCARVAGRLSDAAFARDVHPGFADVAIAATAMHHGLSVVTRNLKHFIPLQVPSATPSRNSSSRSALPCVGALRRRRHHRNIGNMNNSVRGGPEAPCVSLPSRPGRKARLTRSSPMRLFVDK